MSIQPKLLEILVCPASRQTLRLASHSELEALNKRIRAGSQRNQGGSLVSTPVEEGLVREDGLILYPINDGIPVMLVGEALELSL